MNGGEAAAKITLCASDSGPTEGGEGWEGAEKCESNGEQQREGKVMPTRELGGGTTLTSVASDGTVYGAAVDLPPPGLYAPARTPELAANTVKGFGNVSNVHVRAYGHASTPTLLAKKPRRYCAGQAAQTMPSSVGSVRFLAFAFYADTCNIDTSAPMLWQLRYAAQGFLIIEDAFTEQEVRDALKAVDGYCMERESAFKQACDAFVPHFSAAEASKGRDGPGIQFEPSAAGKPKGQRQGT